MMLVEQTTIPSGSLPVQEFKDHLRLGTGFADDDLQDAVLEPILRAAIAAIEAHTSKVTLTRAFEWPVTAWRDLAAQTLPVAPVSAIDALSIIDRRGDQEVIARSRFTLVPDTHRPKLATTGFCLPPIPVNGRAVIGFQAGFGPSWAYVPADLAQAVLMLAAIYYEDRAGEDRGGALPAAVAALVHRHRDLRLFGGGRT